MQSSTEICTALILYSGLRNSYDKQMPYSVDVVQELMEIP